MDEIKIQARKLGLCPYSFQKKVALYEADLIIGCYVYLLDEEIREKLDEKVNLKDTIMIFDEAHNIPI